MNEKMCTITKDASHNLRYVRISITLGEFKKVYPEEYELIREIIENYEEDNLRRRTEEITNIDDVRTLHFDYYPEWSMDKAMCMEYEMKSDPQLDDSFPPESGYAFIYSFLQDEEDREWVRENHLLKHLNMVSQRVFYFILGLMMKYGATENAVTDA